MNENEGKFTLEGLETDFLISLLNYLTEFVRFY